MQKSKKLLALLLVMVMVFSMPLAVSAEDEGDIEDPEVGTTLPEEPNEPEDELLGNNLLNTLEIYFPYESGTQGDPYKIAVEQDLVNLRAFISSGGDTTGVYFEQTANIPMTAANWDPIGWVDTSTNPATIYAFKGTYDGQGYFIDNLLIDRAENNTGLFGYVLGGTIENVVINSGHIQSTAANTGAIVGYNDNGIIRNSINNATVEGVGTTTAVNAIGGLVGYSNGTSALIENCYNTGVISGYQYVGGIAGLLVGGAVDADNIITAFGAVIQNCYNAGVVTATIQAGGIIGHIATATTVRNTYNVGVVTASGGARGGIAGSAAFVYIAKNNYFNRDFITSASTALGTRLFTSEMITSGSMNGLGNAFVQTDSFYPELDVFANSTVLNATVVKELSVESVEVNEPASADEIITLSGSGTEIDPYLVTNAKELNEVRWLMGNGVYFKQTDDINLVGINWEPIGVWEGAAFKGVFDGSNKYIKNLTIDRKATYSSLIGQVTGGTIENVVIASGSVHGVAAANGVVSYNRDGIVQNCLNNAAITGTGSWASGVVGTNNNGGIVRNCYNTGNITGANETGGVVSRNNGTNPIIENCYNTGNVTGTSNVGGIVATVNTGVVRNSHNSGEIRVTVSQSAGGIVGENLGRVENCYNAALGTVNGSTSTGGIVGRNSGGAILNCYNNAAINGTSSQTGGVVGGNNSVGIIRNCYNTGNVIGNNETGGVVGRSSYVVENCYNTGEVLGGSWVGGVIGYVNHTNGKTEDCYNIGEVTSKNSGSFIGGAIGNITAGCVTENVFYNSTIAGTPNALGTPLTTLQMTGGIATNGSTPNPLENALSALSNVQDIDGNPVFVWSDTTPMFASFSVVVANWSYYPELAVFANSTDATVKAASRASVSVLSVDSGTDATISNNADGTTTITISDSGDDPVTVQIPNDDNYEMTLPAGTVVTIDPSDGVMTIVLPNGMGTITVPYGSAIDTDSGVVTIVTPDGTEITVESGADTIIDLADGGVITAPAGSGVTALDDGILIVGVPGGGTVTMSDEIGDTTIEVIGGETVVKDGSGDLIIQTPDDADIVINGDGTVDVTLSDGTEVNAPEGSTVSEGAESGTATVELPSGTEVTVPNGSVVNEGTEPDTADVILPDGTEVNVPDGTTITVDTDGTISITLPSGPSGTVILPEGSVTAPGGSTIIPNGDGTVTIILEDGTSIVVTPDADITIVDDFDPFTDDTVIITVPDGGDVTITTGGDETTITLPDDGGTIKINPDDTITVVIPGENSPTDDTNVTVTPGTDVEIDVDGDGNVIITVPGNEDTTVTVTPGTDVEVDVDGDDNVIITVPGGDDTTVTVTPGIDVEIDVDGGGNVIVTVPDAGGDATVTVPEGSDVTVDEDGFTVTEPGEAAARYYTVRFNANGGTSAPAAVTVKEGTSITLPSMSRNGYVFVGWNTTSGASTALSSSYTVNAGVTLYAVWRTSSGTYIPPTPPTTPDEEVIITDTPTPRSGGALNMSRTAYINGKGSGLVAPDAHMTRAEVAQMFYNLLVDKNVGDIDIDFSDVPSGAWYYDAVTTLASLGIINGYADGTFKPEGNITRAEFVTIASRFDELLSGVISFSDVPTTHWAYDYIVNAVACDWVNGYPDGTFKPEQYITRAEAIKITNVILERTPDKEAIDNATNLNRFNDLPANHWAYYEIMEATNNFED